MRIKINDGLTIAEMSLLNPYRENIFYEAIPSGKFKGLWLVKETDQETKPICVIMSRR